MWLIPYLSVAIGVAVAAVGLWLCKQKVGVHTDVSGVNLEGL